MHNRRHRYWVLGPLLLGVVLLAVTLARSDTRALSDLALRLGIVLPLALLPSLAWHLLRTAAWLQCFPKADRPSFGRAFRLRLAAEAVSFVTISGVAGDPLKVVLLRDEVAPAVGAAAVALERILYLAATTMITSAAALAAIAMLPLSRPWLIVFASIAIVPPLAATAIAAWLRRRRSPTGCGEAQTEERSKARRFLRELGVNLRTAIVQDPRRIVRVGAIQAAAYAAMALEVWVALRLVDAPITWAGALTVETFTRVTSMITAFIPANIGALEASNVAGAAAVHVGAGGLALALVRRVRGLLWCAAGFVIYPRASRRRARADGPVQMVVDRGGEIGPTETLAGLPIGERLAREAIRNGYGQLVVFTPDRAAEWHRATRRVQSLIHVRIESGAAAFGDAPHSRVDFPVNTRADLAAAERQLRASIIKPTDGPLARFNRRISIPISVASIRLLRMNANIMSLLIIALGLWSGWLFASGDYVGGVLAALVSWAASVLDGCDGELARLQYSESAFGCWVDTIGDYTYYIAIFAGLTVGSARATGWSGFWWLGASLAAGLFLTFALLIVLRGRITAGRPEQLNANAKAHFYRSGKRWKWLVAKLSNCATRANMPYGILVLAVLNLLPVVLVLAVIGAHVYWISLAVELRRLLAGSTRAMGSSVSMAETAR